GDRDKPRILGAFNEKTPDWLSYLMFTYFTDRDGKYQLASLAESGFDPLSRTCRFMLTEEALHLFVGETGIGRVVQRTCELMRESKTGDVRRLGGIDLATLQRYINFHYSVSLDLFGSEITTNAANFYTMGLKARFEEVKKREDHRLKDTTYAVSELTCDRITTRYASALSSRMNASELLPAQFNAATWFVARNVTEGRGAVPAFSYEGNTLSYADVLELVNRTGNALLDFGVEPENRVLMLCLDTPEFIGT